MIRICISIIILLLAGCKQTVWNDPYPASERDANTLYLSFVERPKHLDPAQSYSDDEIEILAQIYEPPLQYHYLKRPYTLIPDTLTAMPQVTYLDAAGHPLPKDAPAERIAQSVYELHVRPGIYYQPHPAFARDRQGLPYYRAGTFQLPDSWDGFKHTGMRELVAADYVYEIKRLASPQVNSPILGLMSGYIVGLKDYADLLAKQAQSLPDGRYLDLTRISLAGAEVVDRYTYRIRLKGKYPQFMYWLAMPFFAPIAPEVDAFYHLPGMAKRNLTLDWHPVGTGAYQLAVNDPNRQIRLTRNPYFHGERYPSTGEPGDRAAGLLRDAGKPLPFIDTIVFNLEKETIPYWNKFLQGYYDLAAVNAESFDQAIRIDAQGNARLSDAMSAQGMSLVSAVMPSISFVGFNMLDNVVGGYTKRARQLRQAISIAVDYEEFIAIFQNGGGIPAQGPIPPGIFGYEGGVAGMNPVVYHLVNGKIERRPLSDAQRLLAEAGYPNGRDARTGAPLVLYYDNTFTGPNAKAYVDWMVNQFAKLNIQLVPRSTDYNRFQDKIRRGNAQIFVAGWNADYPDPENFLGLLYGPDGQVKYGGENQVNYKNARYDVLYDQMKYLDNTPQRQLLINQMVGIAQQDAPWMFGYFPRSFGLRQQWVSPGKLNVIANNTFKYRKLDPQLRQHLREQWNKPVIWPVLAVLAVLAIMLAAVAYAARRRDRKTAK